MGDEERERRRREEQNELMRLESSDPGLEDLFRLLFQSAQQGWTYDELELTRLEMWRHIEKYYIKVST